MGRFELYRDRAGQFRWRLVHANGHVIADSGQGYASKQKALQGIRSVKRNAPTADVVEPARRSEPRRRPTPGPGTDPGRGGEPGPGGNPGPEGPTRPDGRRRPDPNRRR